MTITNNNHNNSTYDKAARLNLIQLSVLACDYISNLNKRCVKPNNTIIIQNSHCHHQKKKCSPSFCQNKLFKLLFQLNLDEEMNVR